MSALKTARVLLLIAAATLSLGAARKPPTPAKPPPAKTAPAKAVAAGAPFDARSPDSLARLLASLDAHAEPVRSDTENVMLKVTSPAGGFQVQFGGCDSKGHSCAAVQFDAGAEQRTATWAEINAFNQSSLACRLYQDRGGKPHVLYSALLFASTGREDMLGHIAAWRGCLSSFGDFLKDPNGYLATAP